MDKELDAFLKIIEDRGNNVYELTGYGYGVIGKG